MQITTLCKQGILILRLEGELDMHTADYFRRVLDDQVEHNATIPILLNLKKVTFVDSSGLGVILGRYKKISMSGGKMMVTELQPQIKRIFEMSGLLKLITLYHSEMEALHSLREGL